MSESDLQTRLDRIERRLLFVVLLLVYPYLAGATWLVMGASESSMLFAAVVPGVALAAAAYLAALYRARSSSDGTAASSAG